MPIQICSTCGTSFPDASEPPSCCPICEDERQFVPLGGQVWTTPEKLARGHVNAWRQLERGLFEIHTHPQFGIGQRALLLRTAEGNLLWDCVSLLDDATKAFIGELGGLRAIAISHPHYYTCMQDWDLLAWFVYKIRGHYRAERRKHGQNTSKKSRGNGGGHLMGER